MRLRHFGILALSLALCSAGFAAQAAGRDEASATVIGNHNGSEMEIFTNKIVYDVPKASIRDVVSRGTVLVEGRWTGERFNGYAYAFKKGCPAARYAVTGRHTSDGLMFTGPGPVRNGCDVVGYDPKSPHARLAVTGIWSP